MQTRESIRCGVAVLVAALGFSTQAAAETRLSGAGATFPQPLFERWVVEYQKQHPDVKIDYQGIGSGGGVKAILDKTVAFAASDAPLSPADVQKAGGDAAVIEVPVCAGGVVPVLNVPGVKGDLKLTGDIIADIYLGKVSRWNDARIAAINPGMKLPELSITPVWRTDGSGTTFVFTNYLATQSTAFKGTVGKGKQVRWPIGQGGKGNPGVTAVVQQTPGSIGYVEQNYAVANKLAYASVQNARGKFIKASVPSITAASAPAAAKMQGTLLTADIWNAESDAAYPISSFSYVIVYRDLRNITDVKSAQALADFLWWATHDGQKLAPQLDYAPIDAAVQMKVGDALKQLRFEGKPVLAAATRG